MAVREIVEKDISILPTKNIIQGITSCYGFSEEEEVETNIGSMAGFLDDAKVLSLHRCVKDTLFGDKDLKKDDWFVTLGDDILGVSRDSIEAVEEAVDAADIGDADEVSIYHGMNFDPRELDNVVAALRNRLPDATVEHHFGGQSRSALIISFE